MIILFACEADKLGYYVLLYNTLAFSSQCLSGLLADKFKLGRLGIFVSLLTLALLYFSDCRGLLAVIVCGLCNSFFHVCGGYLTLCEAKERAWPLGVFVAPGCVGLFLGLHFPSWGFVLALLAIVCSVAVGCFGEDGELLPVKKERSNALVFAGILLVAVAARSFGGSNLVFAWKQGLSADFLLVLLVFGGKILGGFLMDRMNSCVLAVLSILPAAFLVAYGCDAMCLALSGQFLLNLTMPLTLRLIYDLLPGRPGFAFGLAACALWPGALLADLLDNNGLIRLFCLLSGLVAIIYVERVLADE